MSNEKRFPTTKGLQGILKTAEAAGVRVHGVGFSNNSELIIPSADVIVGRLRDISGTDEKYVQYEIIVNGVKKFASLGCLYRKYKFFESDKEFLQPNAEKNQADLMNSICGKTIVLSKIENAKAPKFGVEDSFEPISVFKYTVKSSS